MVSVSRQVFVYTVQVEGRSAKTLHYKCVYGGEGKAPFNLFT
jgi:hypothetical protein